MATGCGGSGGTEEPIGPKEQLKEYQNYVNLFGDIHVHTNLSDGDDSPDYALRYARDVSKLDFSCLSDHAEWMTQDNLVALPYYRSIPAKYDDAGKFCVLYGFEWTSKSYGHRNVYTLDNQVPILSSDLPQYTDIDKFWKALSGYDVITVPHHPMMRRTFRWWDYSNPDIEPIVEFYSKWGLSLYEGNERPLLTRQPGYGVYDALNHGRNFGLIGSTDTHLSRPASRLKECRPGALEYTEPGIVVVWAAAHTRQAIFDALKHKRCYGTTGSRINLQLAINKAIMGSSTQSSSSPVIAFRVSADVPISKVTIVKFLNNTNTVIKTLQPNTLETAGIYTDGAFTQDASYLLRADLSNTDMALSSPIYVKKVNSGSIV